MSWHHDESVRDLMFPLLHRKKINKPKALLYLSFVEAPGLYGASKSSSIAPGLRRCQHAASLTRLHFVPVASWHHAQTGSSRLQLWLKRSAAWGRPTRVELLGCSSCFVDWAFSTEAQKLVFVAKFNLSRRHANGAYHILIR